MNRHVSVYEGEIELATASVSILAVVIEARHARLILDDEREILRRFDKASDRHESKATSIVSSR